jgi:hypothetical protein
MAYLGLLAPFRMLDEAHYLNKTVRVFQVIVITRVYQHLPETINNLQNHSGPFSNPGS